MRRRVVFDWWIFFHFHRGVVFYFVLDKENAFHLIKICFINQCFEFVFFVLSNAMYCVRINKAITQILNSIKLRKQTNEATSFNILNILKKKHANLCSKNTVTCGLCSLILHFKLIMNITGHNRDVEQKCLNSVSICWGSLWSYYVCTPLNKLSICLLK